MSIPTNLFLRDTNSPRSGDVNRNVTLSHTDLDNNLIYLKGLSVSGITNSASTVSLNLYNGNSLTFNVTGGTGGGTAFLQKTIIINAVETEVVGKSYQTFASALVYAAANSSLNFNFEVDGVWTEDFTLLPNTSITGRRGSTFLNGILTPAPFTTFTSGAISNCNIGNLNLMPGSYANLHECTITNSISTGGTGAFIIVYSSDIFGGDYRAATYASIFANCNCTATSSDLHFPQGTTIEGGFCQGFNGNYVHFYDGYSGLANCKAGAGIILENNAILRIDGSVLVTYASWSTGPMSISAGTGLDLRNVVCDPSLTQIEVQSGATLQTFGVSNMSFP